MATQMVDGISISFVQPLYPISEGAQLFGEVFLDFLCLLAVIYMIATAWRRREMVARPEEVALGHKAGQGRGRVVA